MTHMLTTLQAPWNLQFAYRHKRAACAWLAALLALAVGGPQAWAASTDGKVADPLKAAEAKHTEIFSKFGPAVVGITCAPKVSIPGVPDGYSGTGAVISADGMIVTNITTVPKDARNIKVYFTDGNVRGAKFIEADNDTEGSLIKVEAKDLPYMHVSDSKDYKVGDPVYSWGNPFNSIQRDGSVSFSAGNISGVYLASSVDNQSRYVGPVLETDAAVNPGSDGGPLTDSEGNLIGVLSLAYSRTRWLGLAIPSATIAGKLPKLKDLMSCRCTPLNSGERAQATALQAAFKEVTEKAGQAVISLRIVRENDKEEAPADWKSVTVKSGQLISTNRAQLEGRRPPEAFATAFMVSADGVALTAYFNVEDKEVDGTPRRRNNAAPRPNQPKKTNAVKKIYAYLADGRRCEAKLLGAHISHDVAALKLDLPPDAKVPFIEFDSSGSLSTGSSIAILGRSEPPGSLTLNAGRISAMHRKHESCSQINALMNYGNIGGPIVNLDGKIVGMAAHLTTTTEWRQNCGVGFMLNAAEIKKVLPDLAAGKLLGKKPGYLGIMGSDHGDGLGAVIDSVVKDLPAENAGLKAGDVVVEYNGKKITDYASLRATTLTLNEGDKVKLKIKRGDQMLEISATLAERD